MPRGRSPTEQLLQSSSRKGHKPHGGNALAADDRCPYVWAGEISARLVVEATAAAAPPQRLLRLRAPRRTPQCHPIALAGARGELLVISCTERRTCPEISRRRSVVARIRSDGLSARKPDRQASSSRWMMPRPSPVNAHMRSMSTPAAPVAPPSLASCRGSLEYHCEIGRHVGTALLRRSEPSGRQA